MLDDKDEFEDKQAEHKRRMKALRKKQRRAEKRCYEAWVWLLGRKEEKEKQNAR